MELTIKEKTNPLLHRKELTGDITFTGATPSNKQVQEELARKMGTQAELIAIRHVYGEFGGGKATFEAYAYETKEQYDKIEPKKKEKKVEGAPAAAPSPAPAKK